MDKMQIKILTEKKKKNLFLARKNSQKSLLSALRTHEEYKCGLGYRAGHH